MKRNTESTADKHASRLAAFLWFWRRRHDYLMRRFEKLMQREKKLNAIYGNSWDTSFHNVRAVRLIQGMRRCNWHLGCLLFFLSVACFPISKAAPTAQDKPKSSFFYTASAGAFQAEDTSNNLSVSVLTDSQNESAALHREVAVSTFGEARESTNRTPVTGKGINNRPDSRGAQNSLASELTDLGFLTDSVGNFYTERTGDATCDNLGKMLSGIGTIRKKECRSSAASNVQPADAAKLSFCFLNNTLDILHKQTDCALGGEELDTTDQGRSPPKNKVGASSPDNFACVVQRQNRSFPNFGCEFDSRYTLFSSACPQSVAAPAALSEPKISVAEVYSRLVEERKIPWSEPEILEGNRGRVLEVRH